MYTHVHTYNDTFSLSLAFFLQSTVNVWTLYARRTGQVASPINVPNSAAASRINCCRHVVTGAAWCSKVGSIFGPPLRVASLGIRSRLRHVNGGDAVASVEPIRVCQSAAPFGQTRGVRFGTASVNVKLCPFIRPSVAALVDGQSPDRVGWAAGGASKVGRVCIFWRVHACARCGGRTSRQLARTAAVGRPVMAKQAQ